MTSARRHSSRVHPQLAALQRSPWRQVGEGPPSLGQPGNFFRVQVRALWGDYFRVNVLVGPDIASVKVAHSYFLLADGSGNILSSNPEITKRY